MIAPQDTILVPIASLVDSVRAVPPADGWLAPANVIAILAAVGTLALSGIVVRLELRQNATEGKRRKQQTEATDKRVGILAYALARQLKTWLGEPVGGLGSALPDKVIRAMRASRELGILGDEDQQTIMGLANWVRARCAEPSLGPAERRADLMAEAALTASPVIGRKAIWAFNSFQQATDKLNRGLACVEGGELEQARWMFISGYDILEVAVDEFENLIPEDLRGELFIKDGQLYNVVNVSGPRKSNTGGGPQTPPLDAGATDQPDRTKGDP